MKKILSILFMCALFYTSHAQTAFSQTASNPTGALLDATIDTMTYTMAKPYAIVSIQPVVTKATGTMAGWAVLDYSLNGTNWYVGTDTLSLTNVTTSTVVWTKNVAVKYFRIRVGGATTVTGTAAAKIAVVR